jgi:lipopolysaccharide export LptBFGC system permease protein LptF
MESPTQRHLFRLYWRRFLPLWLLPIPIAALVLFANLASEDNAGRVLPYLITGIIIYLVATQLRPLGLWRRGEITYWEMQLLSAPIALVALVCILGCVFAVTPIRH